MIFNFKGIIYALISYTAYSTYCPIVKMLYMHNQNISKNEIISFGISPDKYKFTISGTDLRENIPTSLTRDFKINVYKYHDETVGYPWLMP